MQALIATEDDLKPERRPYKPYGAAEKLLYCREPEVLLSGPAGTGKSRANLEKLHLCAMKYPGMRGLMIRKTRESMTESVLVTFEQKVVPEGHPILNGAQRKQRQSYQYPNGSEIIVSGLKQAGRDQIQKVMSTEYDMIYVAEAIELTDAELERLTTRLRNNVMPYQQLLADTNPDGPQHWLKRRCDAGFTTLLESRHEDNPTVWDRKRKAWTPEGAKYIEKLDRLTGSRRDRLRFGRWVQSEGVVYEDWDRAAHIIDRPRVVNPDWPRYWVIDFGYTNPFVCQFWAMDPDGRLYRYREIYRTGRLVEDHVRAIKASLVFSEPRPRAIICDHDAEDRATLERHLKMQTVPAKKAVSPGIQAVAARLRKAGDGKPRLFFYRDSLVERDPTLEEAKKPCCTEEEMDGYVWDLSNSRKKGEEPLKENDHGADCTRYVCAHFDLKQRAGAPSVLYGGVGVPRATR